jgi:predicted NUDIX family NTP pyrophosphohydrolase
LLYHGRGEALEVFLAHPGGPFWKNKDAGAWTIPKGLINGDEDPLTAARREFEEETGIVPSGPFLPLGVIRQKAGKLIHAWAWEGEADPAAIKSNFCSLQFPPGSGKWISIPEVDRCGWFSLSPGAREDQSGAGRTAGAIGRHPIGRRNSGCMIPNPTANNDEAFSHTRSLSSICQSAS